MHIGLFYYTLGNIRPCYRSTLKAIQLISIFKVRDLQEVGINAVLTPFMNDLKLLEQVIFLCILYLYNTYSYYSTYMHIWVYQTKVISL